jgi:hypothetical protein
MKLSHSVVVLTALAASAAASAAVIVSNVSSSVTMGNSSATQSVSAAISAQVGISGLGTSLGTFGSAPAATRGFYRVQALGAAGSGAHGGNLYTITVVLGAIKKVGPFAQTYKDPIVQSAYTVGGSAASYADLAFGAGSGGLKFDDFGAGTTRMYVDSLNDNAGFSMNCDPYGTSGVAFQVTGATTNRPEAAFVNADGSVGFSTRWNSNNLWQQGTNVSSFFSGNLAAFDISGFGSTFVVEAANAVPAPGAIALVGLAGFVKRRRG